MFLSLFFTLFAKSYKFYLKKPDADLYMGRPEADVYYTKFAAADIFELKPSGEVNQDHVVVTTKDNKILDVSRSSGKLIYYSEHGGDNQQFKLQMRGDQKIKIINREKCISYNTLTSKFNVEQCFEGNLSQEFIIQPVQDEITKPEHSGLTVEVDRLKLEALKRTALQCDTIKEEFGAEAIAELGETPAETKQRFTNSAPLALF